MYLASVLHQTSRLAFGRETAQFEALVTLMGAISLVIWSIVLATIIFRMGWAAWHRHRYQAMNDNLWSSESVG
jgi:hypothetical protein